MGYWEPLQERAKQVQQLLEANWPSLPKVEVWLDADWWFSGEWRGIGEFFVRRSLGRGDITYRHTSGRHDTRLHFNKGELVQLVVTENRYERAWVLSADKLDFWRFDTGNLPLIRRQSSVQFGHVMEESKFDFFFHECRTRLTIPHLANGNGVPTGH